MSVMKVNERRTRATLEDIKDDEQSIYKNYLLEDNRKIIFIYMEWQTTNKNDR